MKYRITERFVLEGMLKTQKFKPHTVGRAAIHQTRVPGAPSNPALNGNGVSIISLTAYFSANHTLNNEFSPNF